MSDRWTDRLSEYLDGNLAARERRELERHLVACTECSTTLADLESVVSRAHDLGHAAPPADLWPAISARLVSRQRRAAPGAWWRWQVTLSLPQAAAAGVALVLISAATTWMVGRAPMPVTRGPSVTGRQPFAVGPGPAAPSPSMRERERRASAVRDGAPQQVASATPAPVLGENAMMDPKYDATIASLQRLLEQERSNLDPSTVKVVERNLKIIDRALGEARRAVAADPSSFYLRDHLARVMKQKVNLLMMATSMAGEQG